MNWYFWSKKRTGRRRQWRWYQQWQWTSILESLENESSQCGTVFLFVFELTLFNTSYFTCFQCILTAYACISQFNLFVTFVCSSTSQTLSICFYLFSLMSTSHMHAGLHWTHVLNTFNFSSSVMFLLFQIFPMVLTTAFPLVISQSYILWAWSIVSH